MSKPELFVEPDPELPLALLDQKEVRSSVFLVISIYHNLLLIFHVLLGIYLYFHDIMFLLC